MDEIEYVRIVPIEIRGCVILLKLFPGAIDVGLLWYGNTAEKNCKIFFKGMWCKNKKREIRIEKGRGIFLVEVGVDSFSFFRVE